MTSSLAKEGVSVSVGAGNADLRFAGAFRVSGGDRVSRARFRLCRETSRMPASARQSQNVPVSYPRSAHISSGQATAYAHLQDFSRSPLANSNRRPPPYHLTPAATTGNPRQQIWLVLALSAAGRFAADCHWLRLLGSINAPSGVSQFRAAEPVQRRSQAARARGRWPRRGDGRCAGAAYDPKRGTA
jgi:hypothetical protein